MLINDKTLNVYSRSMTIGDPITALQQAAEEIGKDAEVRLMTQQNSRWCMASAASSPTA